MKTKILAKWWHDHMGGWEFIQRDSEEEAEMDTETLARHLGIFKEVEIDTNLLERYRLICEQYDLVCDEISLVVDGQKG